MNITNNSNVTSDNSTNTSNGTNSTVCTTQYGPFINFTVDFTSYFIGKLPDKGAVYLSPYLL